VSGWELFTWLNAAILGIGALLVFVAFLRDLPGMLARQQHSESEPERDAEPR
jgi:hypothetical protein